MGIVVPQKCPGEQLGGVLKLQVRDVHIVVVICLWNWVFLFLVLGCGLS
jgi:hypothetical protein